KLADDDESDEIDEEEFYLKRLEGGLFTLQSIDQIITWISKDEPKTLENYTFPTSYLLKKSDSENDYFSLSFDQIKEHIETLSNQTGRNIIDANDVETVLEGRDIGQLFRLICLWLSPNFPRKQINLCRKNNPQFLAS
ncbi:4892_t:CDS:2, partial [Entrophospora sp. SA101]